VSSKSLTFNSKVGIVMALIGFAGYIWTFFLPLRSMEVFVPRIALLLITLGGVLIPIREYWKPDKKENIGFTGILPYAVIISVAMWFYGWAFRNIGLMTSTFFFLFIWWIWAAYRDAKRKGSFKEFLPKVMKMALLAAAITFTVYFLFIRLLSMYLPRTPLP